MSLDIMFNHSDGYSTWVPLTRPKWEVCNKAAFIQADGHELEAILERFPYLSDRLPKPCRVATFVGDEARHILFNLGLLSR